MFSWTDITFHVIPKADVSTLLREAEPLPSGRFAPAYFGTSGIDLALLKLLSFDDEYVEVCEILAPEDVATYPHADEIVAITITVELPCEIHAFCTHAEENYGIARTEPFESTLYQAIRWGELLSLNEARIAREKHRPPSHHEEMDRRAAVSAAHRAWAERHL
jgi:hypothetical protein